MGSKVAHDTLYPVCICPVVVTTENSYRRNGALQPTARVDA